MSKIFYIDIPTEATIQGVDGPWRNLTTFKSKKEAVEWIREHIGYCDDDGNVCLITEGGV